MKNVDTRFGGREAGGVFRFELTGGALALDFVNTLDERQGEPKELLTDYQRLLDWSEQAGALATAACARLKKTAAGEPRKAKEALKRARDLREILYSILERLTHGDLEERDIEPLNSWIGKAGARARLYFVDGAIVRSYADDGSDFAAMLWPIVDSAASLLADEQSRARIKLCEGEGCAWVFVDTSRQGNKRWCDMSVCGNRAKARRHRKRKSAAA
jgi:predicted RNA-binding Zn ribbon-like protein